MRATFEKKQPSDVLAASGITGDVPLVLIRSASSAPANPSHSSLPPALAALADDAPLDLGTAF
eukprot:6216705-Pyramimonas_sp.AAC.1